MEFVKHLVARYDGGHDGGGNGGGSYGGGYGGNTQGGSSNTSTTSNSTTSTTTSTAATASKAAQQAYKKYAHSMNSSWEKDIQWAFVCVIAVFLIGYILEELRLLFFRRSIRKSNAVYQWPRNVLNNISLWSFKIPVIHSRVYAPIGILGLAFMGFLTAGLLANTPDQTMKVQFDLRSIANRSGHIGVALLPMLFILSLKNSPIGLLIGSSHEKLNIVHRWIGRIVVSIIAVHLVTYTVLYAQSGSLKKLVKFSNLCGIIAFVLMLLIGITSVAIARRKAYEYFFILHWVFTIATLVFSWLHDRDTIPYIKASAGIIGGDLVLRVLRVWTSSPWLKFYSDAQVETINEDWVSVTVNRPRFGLMSNWTPGTHAFLNIPSIGMHQKHPFTIASIPEDGHIRFLIKKQRGFTKSLHQAPLHQAQKSTMKCLVDGPYGSLDVTRFSKYPDVLLIGAGVGYAFTLPILKSLLIRQSVARSVTFVWSTSSVTTYDFVRHELGLIYDNHVTSGVQIVLDIRIALTGVRKKSEVTVIDSPAHSPALSIGSDKKGVSQTEVPIFESSITTHSSRINVQDLIHEISRDRLAVGVCGPNGLVLDARRAVSSIRRDQDIWLYTDEFEW